MAMVRALLPNTALGMSKSAFPGVAKFRIRRGSAAGIEAKYIIDPKPMTRVGARKVLRVIQHVPKLRTEAEGKSFAEVQVFINGEVEIVCSALSPACCGECRRALHNPLGYIGRWRCWPGSRQRKEQRRNSK